MIVKDIVSFLTTIAPAALQEDYDNAGLITGNENWECKGVIISLDATEEVIKDAIEKKCNLVIAHHPIIFKGLKKINGKNYVEQTITAAIKNDIAIYSIHTNLDNVLHGVNGKIADMLGLVKRRTLSPKKQLLQKLAVFVPLKEKQGVLDALFAAGAGNIGNYSDCSFSTEGDGTFQAGPGTNPYVGNQGDRHLEKEVKVEVIFPGWLQAPILKAMRAAHPYEEIAYDIYNLENMYTQTGSGLVGDLPEALSETDLLQNLQALFKIPAIKHTAVTGKTIKKVALCGGAGSFLTGAAIGAGADIYITADIKYHEFFDAEGKLLLADIGHYESEQFTIDLLFDLLRDKFPNFAVLKTGINTNPVHYFTRMAH
ncbi:MAG: Nif3-like dinuclear metal center hexameric protein [Gloeobacteraceae cyanobacterium ES-bin-316]|nr:Nif3-like dinuclear metal center hexameric protein [Ferruginibacter sp.]